MAAHRDEPAGEGCVGRGLGGVEVEDMVAVEEFQAAGFDRGEHGLVGHATAEAVVAEFLEHRGGDVGAAAGDVVHREEGIGGEGGRSEGEEKEQWG